MATGCSSPTESTSMPPFAKSPIRWSASTTDSRVSAKPLEKDLMVWGDFNRVPSQIAGLLPDFADKTGSDHALPRFLGRAERDRRPEVEATKSSPSGGMTPRSARSLTRGTA